MNFFGNETDVRLEYYAGNVTRMEIGHSTGWRPLPFIVTAQIDIGPQCVSIENRSGKIIKYSLQAGDAFCVAAGVRHRSISEAAQGDVSRWSHFNLRIFGVIDILDFLKIPIMFQVETARKIGGLNERMSELCATSCASEELNLSNFMQHHALCCELAALLVESANLD